MLSRNAFCLTIFGLFLLVPDGAFAQSWEVLEEESVGLAYVLPKHCAPPPGAADKEKFDCQIIDISCDKETWITIPVAPGTPAPASVPKLKVLTADGEKSYDLTADICGDGECTDRAKGEVSTYTLKQPGKTLALLIAEKAKRLTFSGPGTPAIDVARDDAAFTKFAGFCTAWK